MIEPGPVYQFEILVLFKLKTLEGWVFGPPESGQRAKVHAVVRDPSS